MSAVMALFFGDDLVLLLSYVECTFFFSSYVSDMKNLIMSLAQNCLQRRGKLGRHVLCMKQYSLKFYTTWS